MNFMKKIALALVLVFATGMMTQSVYAAEGIQVEVKKDDDKKKKKKKKKKGKESCSSSSSGASGSCCSKKKD